jgi:hypothetical protein
VAFFILVDLSTRAPNDKTWLLVHPAHVTAPIKSKTPSWFQSAMSEMPPLTVFKLSIG